MSHRSINTRTILLAAFLIAVCVGAERLPEPASSLAERGSAFGLVGRLIGSRGEIPVASARPPAVAVAALAAGHRRAAPDPR